ncbi:MAG: hypothetical protein LBT16_07865 [Treponema sp.]|jgi:hypothetical protein|nr:hypothetical protein [Treponema sp.]
MGVLADPGSLRAPGRRRVITAVLSAVFLSPFVFSCHVKEPVSFFSSARGDTPFYGLSRAAVSGELILVPKSGGKSTPSLRYQFDPPLKVPPGFSLEVEYSFSVPAPSAVSWELKLGASSGDWVLPADTSFLGITGGGAGGVLRYAVPVPEGAVGGLSISGNRNGPGEETAVFRLRSLSLVPRWYGLEQTGAGGPRFTPFVYLDGEGALVIDIPPGFRYPVPPELSFWGLTGGVAVTANNTRWEYRARSLSSPSAATVPARGEADGRRSWVLPGGVVGDFPYPLVISGSPFAAVALAEGPRRPFPAEPAPADPGMVLAYPEEAWRDKRYEVFRWPSFPEILIFDTADYLVQERLFKRLAFFVEKKDYRGRLLSDGELEGRHGWNAHDYRAEDLAMFFEAARETSFPLLPEEQELCFLLLENGVIRQGGSGGEISPGRGALISISRESPDYLRRRFLVHEGYHGLFFIDEDFRNFSRDRYEKLPREAKQFIRSFFDYQRYDLQDSYLIVNEFMAYIMQQTVSQAGFYFGETLAAQIDNSPWRRTVLPEAQSRADGTKHWPSLASLFTREAEAFSAYASRRWGLAAGSIEQVYASTAE